MTDSAPVPTYSSEALAYPTQRKHTLTIIPDGKIIHAGPGENLLTLLTEHGVLLRSDCGGKGGCGKCAVDIISIDGGREKMNACSTTIQYDAEVEIPAHSRMSAHIMNKARIRLPESFYALLNRNEIEPNQSGIENPDSNADHRFNVNVKVNPHSNLTAGIAVDLGTTTIAVYLVNTQTGQVLSSLAVKNPQALYGDDVMSRIGYIGENDERLARLQRLVTGSIEWAATTLLAACRPAPLPPEQMVIVGNPTMIHILLGVSPASIGMAPYLPQFSNAVQTGSGELGMAFLPAKVQTLPQLSGFIGGDILAAAIAVELAAQPAGTLLIDLGTNGELMLKGRDGFYATSCATGPAFEGAALSCGMQAVPGAIDKICIGEDLKPSFSCVEGAQDTVEKGTQIPQVPLGICGSGIISGVAELIRTGIVTKNGSFNSSLEPGIISQSTSPSQSANGKNGAGSVVTRSYRLYAPQKGQTSSEVSISQKDIRQVQLGKAALISGIEFLLAAAGMDEVDSIIVAGAFGSHLDRDDLLRLQLIPPIAREKIQMAGNAAGSGAIMALCDAGYFRQVEELAAQTRVINLAEDIAFQNHFVTRLSF